MHQAIEAMISTFFMKRTSCFHNSYIDSCGNKT